MIPPRRAPRRVTTLAVSALVLAAGPCLAPCAAGQAAPAAALGPADRPAFDTGVIIASVPARSDPAQSYALYLPRAYTPDRRWPMLYLFDPAARGRVAVEVFATAAELHGFIVVGSNTSQNRQDLKATDVVLGTIWQDTHERLAIDGRRTYAGGFSGGARVASLLAQGMQLPGLVAVGAGLYVGLDAPGLAPFAVFGMAGRDDYNYGEVQELIARTEAAGVPAHFEVFEGEHEWPSAVVAGRALAWMDLQAMHSGALPPEFAAVAAFVAGARERLAGTSVPHERHRMLKMLLADVRGLAALPDVAAEVERLERSPAVRKGQRQERALIERQRRMVDELLALEAVAVGIADAPAPACGACPEREDGGGLIARRDLTRRLNELARQGTAGSAATRTLANRTRAQFAAVCWQQAGEARRRKRLDLAVAHLTWAAASRPERPGGHVALAALEAQRGELRKSLAALERAIAAGFSDAHALESEPDFTPLRSDPQYRRLLERMRADR